MTAQTNDLQIAALPRLAGWRLRLLVNVWLCTLALSAPAAIAATFTGLAQEAFERSRLDWDPELRA